MVRALTGCPVVTKTATDYRGEPYEYEGQGESGEYLRFIEETGGLGQYGAVAIDAIVYGGVPLDEAGGTVVVKSDGTARNFVDSGDPPTVGPAVASDWA